MTAQPPWEGVGDRCRWTEPSWLELEVGLRGLSELCGAESSARLARILSGAKSQEGDAIRKLGDDGACQI